MKGLFSLVMGAAVAASNCAGRGVNAARVMAAGICSALAAVASVAAAAGSYVSAFVATAGLIGAGLVFGGVSAFASTPVYLPDTDPIDDLVGEVETYSLGLLLGIAGFCVLIGLVWMAVRHFGGGRRVS